MKFEQFYEFPISVIMSVFNTKEEYLRKAVESILNQSFEDFEFIIFNDCSGEETSKILRQYKDQRIRLVENVETRGLTKNLNTGIAMAKGKYIARMDADDVSLYNRLYIQYSYMEKHLNVDILGGTVLSDNTRNVYWRYFPQEWRRVNMLFGNYGICHPTAFFRTDFLRKRGIFYDETYDKTQDYELWTRVLKLGKMAVCRRPVLYYRYHSNQISSNSRTSTRQIELDMRVRKNLFREMIPDANEEEISQLLNLNRELISAENLSDLFQKLEKENKRKKIYSSYYLKNTLAVRWFWIVSGGLRRERPEDYRKGYWFRYMITPQFWGYYTVYRFLYMLCEPRKYRKLAEEKL